MTATVYRFPGGDEPRPTRQVSLAEDEWNVILAAVRVAQGADGVDRAAREQLAWLSSRITIQLSHPSSQVPR